jgi:hypothetical protein
VLGPVDGRHHVDKVEIDVLGEDGLPLGVVPHALRLGVGLDQREQIVRAAGQPQVVDGDLVNREMAAVEPDSGSYCPARLASGTSATPLP